MRHREPRHDVVVAYLQKGNEANDCMLAIAGSVVSAGGSVFLVEDNSAGIRSNIVGDWMIPVTHPGGFSRTCDES